MKTWVLTAAVLASTMVFLDGSTVNVALAALQESLGATAVDVQWVINGYTLFLAALLMLGGSLGDNFGHKKVFLLGTGLFTAASVWCGLAPSVGQLIAARAAQGVGGALLTPVSLALINTHFPEGERGGAIGKWSAYSAIGAAAGPLVGGWLIDVSSWRWIFFLNVPLAAVAVGIMLKHVKELTLKQGASPIDYVGALLVTLGLGGGVYALLQSSESGWSDPLVAGSGATGVLLLLAFVLWEGRSRAPMVPLTLFRSGAFSGINVVTLLVYGNLAGLSFFLPLYLIQVQGFSAAAAGAASLPMVILLFLLSSWAGKLYDRVGPRLPVAGGALITAASLALFLLVGDSTNYLLSVTLPFTLMGLGMAILVAPLTTTVMAAVPGSLAGTASGVNNAVSRVAGLLAIGALGALMIGVFGLELEAHLDATALTSPAKELMLASRTDLAGMHLPPGLNEAETAAAEAALHSAFTAGYERLLKVMAVVGLGGALVALLTLPGRARKREDGDPVILALQREGRERGAN